LSIAELNIQKVLIKIVKRYRKQVCKKYQNRYLQMVMALQGNIVTWNFLVGQHTSVDMKGGFN